MNIGLDSYSYHRYFGETTAWEQPSAIRWQASDFIARAGQLGVDAVSLQTAYLPELTPDVIAELRALLDAHGLARVLAWGHPSGLEGGRSPDLVEALRRLFPRAQALGCSLVRIVCGNQDWWKKPVQERVDCLAPILRALAEEAEWFGLTLAIENHADFAMCDLVKLVKAVGADHLGLCFDTGNAVRVGDDLMKAAQLAAPYIKMVHLKDMVLDGEWQGNPAGWWPAAPLGKGDFDLRVFLSLLQENYQGTLFIEMANLYPTWTDEDEAVEESVNYLRQVMREVGA
jgi:sugar phosphate isomerase/epimerase